MILVDTRAGSKELIEPLEARGLPVDPVTLEFGDVAFEGRGEHGKAVFVGIEYKKLSELVQAMNDGRFAGHQLPGMVQTYDYRYLLVEGELLINPLDGRLARRAGVGRTRPLQGAPGIAEFHKRLLTYTHRGATIPILVPNRKAAVLWLEAAYHFWTDSDLDGHKSHIALYNRDLDSRLQRPKTDFRTIVGAWPHVGPQVLDAAERVFEGSVERAFLAPATVWASITTQDREGNERRVGIKTATKIREALK